MLQSLVLSVSEFKSRAVSEVNVGPASRSRDARAGARPELVVVVCVRSRQAAAAATRPRELLRGCALLVWRL